MNNGFTHTEEAIKQRGEVFTPTCLVTEMLDRLPPTVFQDATKTFLDNSCGNGQFLSAVLTRKMANGISHLDALKNIYGIELDEANVRECKKRLALGSHKKEIWAVLDKNIICADALDPAHPGWKKVGYMWDTSKINLEITDFFDSLSRQEKPSAVLEKEEDAQLQLDF